MKQAKYFDFFDIDHYKNELNKIAAPYDLEEEVTQARLKLSNDIYYRAATVGREILESVLLKAFFIPDPPIEETSGLIWKIDYLKEHKLINDKYHALFHNIRKIGNIGIHQKEKMTRDLAIEILKDCDMALRYMIETVIDSEYDRQLHIPTEPDEALFLDSLQELEEVSYYVTQSPMLSKEMELEYLTEIKELGERIKQLDKRLNETESFLSQLNDPDNKIKIQKLDQERKQLDQKQVTYYRLTQSLKEKVVSEVDWIYQVLHGKGMATKKQLQAMNAPNDVYKINGLAGSGKSLVLLMKCLKAIDDRDPSQVQLFDTKKRAILLTYNKSLMNYLKNIVEQMKTSPYISDQIKENIEALTIINFDRYIWDLAKHYDISMPIELLRSNRYQDKFDYIFSRLSTIQDLPTYDIVAIDEAQDLSISSIKFIYQLKSKDPGSKFYIVFDEAQKIYKGDFTAKAIDEDLNFRGNAINLETNLRNHPNIHKIAEGVLKNKIKKEDLLNGDYITDNTFIASEEEVLDFRVKDHDNVAYLFTNKKDLNQFQQKLVEEAQISLQDIKDYDQETTTGYYIGTVHSAKGLEFDSVFLFDIPDSKELRYVSVSRARNRLVFVSKDSIKTT